MKQRQKELLKELEEIDAESKALPPAITTLASPKDEVV